MHKKYPTTNFNTTQNIPTALFKAIKNSLNHTVECANNPCRCRTGCLFLVMKPEVFNYMSLPMHRTWNLKYLITRHFRCIVHETWSSILLHVTSDASYMKPEVFDYTSLPMHRTWNLKACGHISFPICIVHVVVWNWRWFIFVDLFQSYTWRVRWP